MAWVKAISKPFPNDSRYVAEIWYEIGSQNIQDNTTQVRWELGVRKLSGDGYWDNSSNSSITSQCYGESYTTNFSYDFSSSSYKAVDSWGWRSVAHNADGTKAITMWTKFNLTRFGYLEFGYNLTLPTIPRHVLFTPRWNTSLRARSFGYSVTMPSSVSSCKITLSGSTDIWSKQVSANESTTIPLTDAQYKTMVESFENTNVKAFSFKVESFVGGKSIGTQTYTSNINWDIPYQHPTLRHELVQPASMHSDVRGLVIFGFTQIKVTATANAQPYSNMWVASQNWKTALNGAYKNGVSTSHAVTKNPLIIGVQWTDNHQKSGSINQNTGLTAIAYSRPTVKMEQLKRVNAAGNDDLLGTNVFIKATIGFNSLLSKNGILKVQIGIGSYTTITQDQLAVGYTLTNVDVNKAHVINIKVEDKVTSDNVHSFSVSSGSVDLYIGGDGDVGVGMINNKGSNTFQVKGQAYQNENDPIKDFFSIPIEITGTFDFNNYWRQGIYVIPTSVNADNSINSPKAGAGYLIVRNLRDYSDLTSPNRAWLYAWQTFENLNGTIYSRKMGTGDGTVPVWSQWKKITTDNTIADYPFDHGSNSNGEWWKYESGRLVQRISLNADNASPPSKWEAMFTRYFGNSDWTFPIPFVGAPPAVIASCQGAQFGYDNISLTRVWGIYQMRPVNYGFTGGWKTVIAEGRWK
ncbi:hypothetical protein [Erysipelothrix anatis]|uniref:hypothetical protein n=1 Tax=Erysipelothrix anatis TaxID=2683713 RepID=UPI001356B953|nr:hypothetical protein [Erysipelothrix anatis]